LVHLPDVREDNEVNRRAGAAMTPAQARSIIRDALALCALVAFVAMVLTWSALAAKADDDDGKVTGGDSLRPSRSKPAMRWFSLQRAQDTLLSIPWHFLCATLPPSPTR
jgi:hypothetical protein